MARYGAELDYGAGLRPAMARLKLDLPLAPGWAFDARLSAPLTHGGPSLDLAATRDIGSFRFGAFVDAAAAGGIIGLRLWLPLDPSDLPPRWFGR
jgi:hypothetical protein